ncbi:galactose oxidase-like protein precursor [Clohesyomyces aquaticus]|uniref:Galactose oxidase-like protein n=1 Tax=Clohesyomyces aquaticus TaxID=1231657 RepID=A0A1Y1Y9H3_9PLEO|nr:galactose oxidase-like protein precursor [Clohesyomyces aquaticus]
MATSTFHILAVASNIGLATSAIGSCPVLETTYTGASGATYAICPSTDYEGRTAQVIHNIASEQACAQLCSEKKCTKAVYDNPGKTCHIKDVGKQLTWVPNTRFTVIRTFTGLPDGVNIARCPVEAKKFTAAGNKKAMQICPDTDFRGPSAKVVQGVTTTTACADFCSTTPGCTRAVFDKAANVCHVKADETKNTLIWSTNKKFDVITLDIAARPAKTGAWGDLIQLPVIPVAAYIVPAFPESTRMLVFSSWGADAFGGASGMTQFADYDFKTGALSARTITNTNHDMFCPGISTLQDGRIVIQGGSDAKSVSFYHPSNNTFTRGPDLQIARGYQTSTTLSDGRIFTIGGAYSGPREGKNGEIYDPKTNTWTYLPQTSVKPMLTVDHEGIWREDNHAWLFSWKNGSVFQAGPSKAQNWYGTAGTGSQVAAGKRDDDDAMCGIWVMYEPGKIFSAGGAPDYTASVATARAHITTIDVPNKPARVERVPDMQYPRAFANAVVLPDGTVFVSGGQKKALVFTDTDGALPTELFDPKTRSWTTLAAQAVPRNYHSVSILLHDGTVFSGGGGLCYAGSKGASTAKCDKSVDHADGQVFTPPYLYNSDGSLATRPTISALSATSVKVGGSITATVNSNAVKGTAMLVLVRIGSVTHSVNSAQRRIPLENVVVKGDKYTVTLSGESGILLPGHYYLFAVDARGVPSLAKTVQVVL